MKKIMTILAILLLVVGCSNKKEEPTVDEVDNQEIVEDYTTEDEVLYEEPSPMVTIKESPDKYTWYVKSYVGKNAATIGYESMVGNRMDSYGASYIELKMFTADGTYVPKTDDELKNYVVVAQNIDPNSEIKLTFQKDSDGEEYDSLVDSSSYDSFLLQVKKVGTDDKAKELVAINPSPDKYTHYVKDYRGLNLANCGYISMLGDLRDSYGDANIELVIVTDDGSYVEIDDEGETLKNYVVKDQSIAPNTEMKFTYMTDSDGNEYDNLIDTMNIESIDLYVSKIN